MEIGYSVNGVLIWLTYERWYHIVENHDDMATGKTLRNYADGLAAFCGWCKKRNYLDHDPLEKLQVFDATPKTKRRALSPDEIQRLLAAC